MGLAAGGVTLALVAACSAFAWVDDAPLVPVEGGRLVGDTAWAWAFLVCAALGLVAYAAGLALLRRRAARLAAVVALAVAIQVAPLAAPLLLSSDAYTYWSYGRIAAVHGGNPYDAAAVGVPRGCVIPVGGRGLARHDLRLRAGVHARLRARRAGRRRVARPRCVDLQGARGGCDGGRVSACGPARRAPGLRGRVRRLEPGAGAAPGGRRAQRRVDRRARPGGTRPGCRRGAGASPGSRGRSPCSSSGCR